jgi:hypothetical protein
MPDLSWTVYFLPEILKDEVKDWCTARYGVRAPYPHGRWTTFYQYYINAVPAMRVDLFYDDDKIAFELAWGDRRLYITNAK